MDKREDELSAYLWQTFDHLGYGYEHVKSLAIAMLLTVLRDKTDKEIYDFLYNIKAGYIESSSRLQ